MHRLGVVGAKVPKTSAERDLQVRHGIHLIRVAQQALAAETSGGTIDLFPQTSTVPTMDASASEKSIRPTVASSAAAPAPPGNPLTNVGGVGRMPPPPSSHHHHRHHLHHQHHMVQQFGGAQAGALMGMASPSSPPTPASAIAVAEAAAASAAAAAATSVAACSRAGPVDVSSSSSSSEGPLFSVGGFSSHQPQHHPSATAAVAGASMATTATTVATMSTVSYPSSGSEVYGNGSCQVTGAPTAPVPDASSAACEPTGMPTGVSANVPTAAPAMVLAAPLASAVAGEAPSFIPSAAEAGARQPPVKAAGEHRLAVPESTAAAATAAEVAIVAAASAAAAAPVVGVALTKQAGPAPQFGYPDPGPTSGVCGAVQWWISSPTCAWNDQG